MDDNREVGGSLHLEQEVEVETNHRASMNLALSTCQTSSTDFWVEVEALRP